ncbi:hypothetical protein EET67_15745 [Pseudaminobacter arsenicus]|uniref:DUF1468 domain-containing protein n=1 Tax=Borborobacter arsenicus TaxID=1851146 RepID=A0A432V4D0_9HYPH|nr:tripartite tricarboxylate transporter TctB family protein [Pseudaminobacter arsenicus]RUM96988.1 hypothetical protein EET67_15745 [Pseudaminobacter arsenicus]
MTRELVGGVLAILLGAGYLAMALQIQPSSLDDAIGPAGLPRVLGTAMVLLGIVLSVQALLAERRRRRSLAAGKAADTAAEDDEAGEIERGGLGGIARAGGLLAIGIGYLLIVRTAGYVPAVAALIIAAALYGGAALTWRVFAIGIAGAVFYYLLFVLVLGIPLPAGELINYF